MDELIEHEIDQFVLDSRCECGGCIMRYGNEEVMCNKCKSIYRLLFHKKTVKDKFNQLVFESVKIMTGKKCLPEQLVIKERTC